MHNPVYRPNRKTKNLQKIICNFCNTDVIIVTLCEMSLTPLKVRTLSGAGLFFCLDYLVTHVIHLLDAVLKKIVMCNIRDQEHHEHDAKNDHGQV